MSIYQNVVIIADSVHGCVMEEDLKNTNVHFSGYVLSQILRDGTCCKSPRVGLLYGEWSEELIDDINDSQQDATKSVVDVVVQDSTPCPHTFAFYDHVGAVQKEKWSAVNNKREEQCIGFYSVRGNTKLSPSLREKTIVRNLLENSHKPTQRVLFFLVTPTKEANQATCTLEYKSYVASSDTATLRAVKTNVMNLGQSERNVYKHRSLLVPSTTTSAKCAKLLQDYTQDKFVSQTGSVTVADSSYNTFNKTMALLNNLQGEVINSNEEIADLKAKIAALQ